MKKYNNTITTTPKLQKMKKYNNNSLRWAAITAVQVNVYSITQHHNKNGVFVCVSIFLIDYQVGLKFKKSI